MSECIEHVRRLNSTVFAISKGFVPTKYYLYNRTRTLGSLRSNEYCEYKQKDSHSTLIQNLYLFIHIPYLNGDGGEGGRFVGCRQ